MSCSCSYNNLPCCCPKDGKTFPCPTTICPDAQPCDFIVESECIIYNGKSYSCTGVTKGMTVKQVIDIIIKSLSLECTTTTTSTTTSTSTSTTSTTSTSTTTTSKPTTTTSTTSTSTTSTTTTTIAPGNNPCTSYNILVNCKCEYTIFSTANSNSQGFSQDPTCGNYLGNDIWIKFIVPASGEVVISTSARQITDGAMSIYSGSLCDNLTEIVCIDDISGSAMPQAYLNNLQPGDTIYIRFWGYGGAINNQVGTFNICVFDAVFDPTCDTPPGGNASACSTTTTTTTADPCNNSGGTGVNCAFGTLIATIVPPTTTTTTTSSTTTTSTSTTSTSTTSTSSTTSTTTLNLTTSTSSTTTSTTQQPGSTTTSSSTTSTSSTTTTTTAAPTTTSSSTTTSTSTSTSTSTTTSTTTELPPPDPRTTTTTTTQAFPAGCANPGVVIINNSSATFNYTFVGIAGLLPCNGDPSNESPIGPSQVDSYAGGWTVGGIEFTGSPNGSYPYTITSNNVPVGSGVINLPGPTTLSGTSTYQGIVRLIITN